MDLGSPREILTAECGFLVNSLDEAVAAVAEVGRVDRHACRQRAGDFSVERMVEGYLRVYEQVLSGSWLPEAVPMERP
jgi:glycosyltransferase involved in cell wall biosynthesis